MAEHILYLATSAGHTEHLKWYVRRPTRIARKWYRYVDKMHRKTGVWYHLRLVQQ